MQYLKEKVLIGQGRCEKTNMVATGIPSHLAMIQEVTDRKTQVSCLTDMLSKHTVDICNFVSEKLKQQPAILKQTMMDNFNIEGVAPITFRDIETMLNDRDNRFFNRLNERDGNRAESNITGQSDNNPQMVASNSDYIFFFWGDKFRMCPITFEFPLFDVKTMFSLWHYGNQELKIRPYKKFNDYRDDLRENKHKCNFDRARLVMNELDLIISNHNFLGVYESLATVSTVSAQMLIFDLAYEKLINQIYGETTPHKRPNDLTLSSVAKKLYVVKNKKQRMALPVDLLVINFKKAKTKLNYS